jgi:hypothetical protein
MVAWLVTIVPGIKDHVVTILIYRLSRRRVDDLYVTTDEHGNQKLRWKERKRPDLTKIRELFGLPASELPEDVPNEGPDAAPERGGM